MAAKKSNVQPITQAELEAWIATERAQEELAYELAMRAFKGAPVETGRIRMEALKRKPTEPSEAQVTGINNGIIDLDWD